MTRHLFSKYDNGAWSKPVAHPKPLEVILVYVPGPLLTATNDLSAQPDINEICVNGIFDKDAYYHMIERRLLPGLLNVNASADQKNEKLFITLPGIGCGAFAGAFRDRMHAEFEEAIRRLLTTHGL